MPGGDVVYRYDGSFDGFLCCVFESYVRRELPLRLSRRRTARAFCTGNGGSIPTRFTPNASFFPCKEKIPPTRSAWCSRAF